MLRAHIAPELNYSNITPDRRLSGTFKAPTVMLHDHQLLTATTTNININKKKSSLKYNIKQEIDLLFFPIFRSFNVFNELHKVA